MSEPPTFSVVIPTYNRMDVLPDVLRALEAQEGAPDFELVLIDDGSSDGTSRFLATHPFTRPAQILEQANRGPAAARNAGVAAARGRWVAFLGDDTVPSRGWLRSHWDVHAVKGEGEPVAVIGYTAWHPRMRLTPFLDYINEYGLQFGYALIDDPHDVPFNFFYTSNLSLSRELLLEEPFDEGFPFAAWEDIEVSYRLTRRQGMRLVYQADAVVSHLHPTSLGRFMRRQSKAGYCAVVFYRRHPELGPFLGLGPEGPPELPPRGRQLWRATLARLLQYTPMRLPRLWEEVLRYHYIVGLRRGWRDGAGNQKGGRS